MFVGSVADGLDKQHMFVGSGADDDDDEGSGSGENLCVRSVGSGGQTAYRRFGG